MEEIGISNSKDNKKNFGRIFSLIFLLIITVLILLSFKFDILNLFNRKKENITEDKQTDVQEITSPFQNLLSSNSNNTGANLVASSNTVYTLEGQKNTKLSQVFYTKMTSYVDDWENILEDNQVLAEVADVGNDVKEYKLIYSKNPSFNHNSVATLKFIPKILKPESITVMEGAILKNTFEESHVLNFVENILGVGDKFAFTCQEVNCDGGILDWVFVIKK